MSTGKLNINPPPTYAKPPAPPAPLRVASMQRSGIEEPYPAAALTPTLSRATGEGAEPLTLEQRIEKLEAAFGRVTLHATNTAMAAVGASHKAPGSVAGLATIEAPADVLDAATAPYVRRVVCAANLCTAGRSALTARTFLGARHCDGMMRIAIEEWLGTIKDEPNAIHYEEIQGFIDQHGAFMTRQEALTVARAAGQIRYRCSGDEHALYSENLY